MELQEILSYFTVKRTNKAGKSYQAICPCHMDGEASLTISEGKDGKVVLHCHAGCSTSDILTEVGLTMADLNGGKERTAPTWQSRMEFGLSNRYGEGVRVTAVYDYRDAGGKYLYSKLRIEGGTIKKKEIRYAVLDRVADTYSWKGVPGKADHVLFNLPALIRTIREGYPVYIVEGEKDVETLKGFHLTATTAGGASDWQQAFAPIFTGAKVIILPDNDEPGEKLCEQICRDLRDYAHAVKVVQTSRLEHGDITDWVNQEGGTAAGLKDLVSAEPWEYAPWIDVKADERTGRVLSKKVNADKLADAICRRVPFLIVSRPADDRDDLYLYGGGVYQRTNKNGAKALIRSYIPCGMASDQTLNNTYALILASGMNRYAYSDLNGDERYVNVENGLLNVHTWTLEPHSPRVLSTMQLPVRYDPEHGSRPVFERFMRDFCLDAEGTLDREKLEVIQEFAGLALSNVKGYRVKKALVLWSSVGNTGKSVLLNLIGSILGPEKVAAIQLGEMDQRSNRFVLGSLIDKRLVSVGDQSGADVKDSALFKSMTGGDPVKIEAKGKDSFFVTFPGAIMIACNSLPFFEDDRGGHIFQRMQIIPAENHIPPDRRDARMLDKLLQEKDAVFLWAMDGLKRLLSNDFHFTACRASEAASTDYRKRRDSVFRFVEENYELTGQRSDMVGKKEFDDAYTAWADLQDGVRPVSKANIRPRMESLGCPVDRAHNGKFNGHFVYRCLAPKPTTFEPVTEEEDQMLPFL